MPDWDNINLKCTTGYMFWDNYQGVCTRCLSHKYIRCNLTCNTLTYTDSYDNDSFCLTESKCPSGCYLNKYKNCLSCGGDHCTDCIELFAEDWKGRALGWLFPTQTVTMDNIYIMRPTALRIIALMG